MIKRANVNYCKEVFRKYSKIKVNDLEEKLPKYDYLDTVSGLLPVKTPANTIGYRRAGMAEGLSEVMGQEETPFSVKYPKLTETIARLATGVPTYFLVRNYFKNKGLKNNFLASIPAVIPSFLSQAGGVAAAKLYREHQIKKILKKYKDTPETEIDPSRIKLIPTNAGADSNAISFLNPDTYVGKLESKLLHT
jgi:hypothetical protein